MTLHEELHYDIKAAINNYLLRFSSFSELSQNKKRHIEALLIILRDKDPVIICEQLRSYINKNSSWLEVFNTHQPARLFRDIKEILRRDKYQELLILKRLIKEKENLLLGYEQNTVLLNTLEDKMENKITKLLKELMLLKKENIYLYNVLREVNLKIKQVEKENEILLKPDKMSGQTKIRSKENAKNNFVHGFPAFHQKRRNNTIKKRAADTTYKRKTL